MCWEFFYENVKLVYEFHRRQWCPTPSYRTCRISGIWLITILRSITYIVGQGKAGFEKLQVSTENIVLLRSRCLQLSTLSRQDVCSSVLSAAIQRYGARAQHAGAPCQTRLFKLKICHLFIKLVLKKKSVKMVFSNNASLKYPGQIYSIHLPIIILKFLSDLKFYKMST